MNLIFNELYGYLNRKNKNRKIKNDKKIKDNEKEEEKEKYVYNENISYLDKSKLDSFRKKFTRKKYRYIYFHEFNI